MISKNPFLKYVMKDQKEDVFHSSAYAKAQNGAAIGASSSESYQVRVNIDKNRTKVRGYGDSELMTVVRSNGPKAKAYTAPISEASSRAAMPVKNPGISLKK